MMLVQKRLSWMKSRCAESRTVSNSSSKCVS